MGGLPVTAQGRETRTRIVRGAAELFGERGVAGTSLDDVLAVTKTSKSQLYHYFGDKHGLVQAVIEYQSGVVLGSQADALASVSSWEDLNRWAGTMVAAAEQYGARGGCPVGTLAAALADTDESFRIALAGALDAWCEAIHGALSRMRDRGLLTPDADLQALATSMLAAIQGGLLLAKTSRDSGRLRTALAGAIAQLPASRPAAAG